MYLPEMWKLQSFSDPELWDFVFLFQLKEVNFIYPALMHSQYKVKSDEIIWSAFPYIIYDFFLIKYSYDRIHFHRC